MKQTYTPPKVIRYGNIEKLTLQKQGVLRDGTGRRRISTPIGQHGS